MTEDEFRRLVPALTAAAVLVIAAAVAILAITHIHRHESIAVPAIHAGTTPPTRSATAAKGGTHDGVPFSAGSTTFNNDLPLTGTTTPTCTGSDLRLHVLSQRTADSTTEMQLVAQSIGQHVCRLDRNTIGLGIAATPNGPLLPVSTGGGIQPRWDPNREPRIDPGATVVFDAGWRNWCGTVIHIGYPAVRPTPTITITAKEPVRPPRCGRSEGTESPASLQIDAIAPAGSALSLAPTIHAPATARAGAILDYQVTLTNPTGATITPTPCPTYTEKLGNLGTDRDPYRATGTDRLSCAKIRAIQPHRSVTLPMRIRVPIKDAGHALTLDWVWGNGNNPLVDYPGNAFRHATVHITH